MHKHPLALYHGVVFSTLISSSAFAAIDIDIQSSLHDQPLQTFDINIHSDIPLKRAEFTSIPAAYCTSDFFPFQAEPVTGTSISKQLLFNYKQHRYAAGDSVCVFVEDEQGNTLLTASIEKISLTEPNTHIETITNKNFDAQLTIDSTRGDTVNRAEFVYRQQHQGNVYNFAMSGQGSDDTDVVLTAYNGTIIASSSVDENNVWSLDSVPVALSQSSVTSHANFYLNTVATSDPSIVISQQRVNLRGEKVHIELTSRPQDPLIEDQFDSGVVSWDFHTPRSINNISIVLLDEPQSCQQSHQNIVKTIDVSGYRFNFLNETELHGYYACLQIEDDTGHKFAEDIGWVRQAPRPEIIITDGIESSLATSNTISGYFVDAQNVSIRYFSNSGANTRDRVLQSCTASQDGTPIDNQSLNLVLSDPTLHDRYVCIMADNGKGGKSVWLSDHALNLTNGISQATNLQQRESSTALPTHLAIPKLMQNSTIANSGCRGVLLAPDLVFSAAHCQAPFFFPTLGKWATAPEKYGFLTPQDEKPQKEYDTARRELYADFQQKGDFSRAAYEALNQARQALYDELNQYHSSHYNVYISPYFGRSGSAARTFSDVVLRELATPYDRYQSTIEYPYALTYSHPTSLHATAGEFRSHGIHEQTPNSGWRGGNIHVLAAPGTSVVEYTLVETSGGESGSALWAYDETLETYGVIGAVRGGGAWSSLWSHGRITRQSLAHSRAKALQRRQQQAQDTAFGYKELRRALANADIEQLNTIIDSGLNLNINGNNQADGWVLARAIDFAMQAHKKYLTRTNDKHLKKFERRIDVIKALMLGGANPQLTVIKPTRYMDIAPGDSVLHYAVRTNNSDIMKAIWLNTTDYAFESDSRALKNDAGDTPLHIAISNRVNPVLTRLLFADVGQQLFIENSLGESAFKLLLTQGPLSPEGIETIDWVGKAFSYEPVSITETATISNDEWAKLYCAKIDIEGSAYALPQYAQYMQPQVSEAAFAALSRLGNLSGVDASHYCQ